MSKRPPSPTLGTDPKRARAHVLPTLDTWLSAPARLLASSPHLHAGNSTFIGFTLPFVPTSKDLEAIKREARHAVRDLDVVSLVGNELTTRNEGAFADGQGRARGKKNRAREPDHRMWAVRTLALCEGKDGTGGEGDYQLVETSDDDGEKFGGERVLRVLREQGGIDVLTVCCRWFGGDMLGPARFHHIGITSQHSLTELQRLVALRDLRADLVRLDGEIDKLRETIAAGAEGANGATNGDPSSSANGSVPATPSKNYNDIEDVPRLERLVRAKEKSKANLEARVAAAAGA